MLYWVSLLGIILIGAYALMMTGHFANRTPRQRVGLITSFLLCCLIFLVGPTNITRVMITSWESFTKTHQRND